MSEQENDREEQKVVSAEGRLNPLGGRLNPNFTIEDQDMAENLTPVIVGPPAYASPDPQTEAGLLVDINEHPNKELISEDYGADVKAALGEQVQETTMGEETGSGSETIEPTDVQESGDGGEASEDLPEDYEDWTVAQLKTEATRRNLEGFSSMNKAELIELLLDDDAS